MKLIRLILTVTFFLLMASCTSVSTNGSAKPATSAVSNQSNQEEYIPIQLQIVGYSLTSNGNVIHVKTVGRGSFIGGFHPPIVIADYSIKPSKAEWKTFWYTLNRLDVWRWKPSYHSNRTEGWTNQLKITYPTKQVVVSIKSKNPPNYQQFIDAVGRLVKYKENTISRDEYLAKRRVLMKKKPIRRKRNNSG